MKTRFQVERCFVIVPWGLIFALMLLLSSSAIAQTELTPNPNPAGNTISMEDWFCTNVDYVNDGTIVGAADTPWELDNNDGVTFTNAGTIEINPSTRQNLFDYSNETGLFNYGTFVNTDTGIIDNKGHVRMINSVFTNYGYVDNRYDLVYSLSTINNYGTIINDGTSPNAGGEWPNQMHLCGSTLYNYGEIVNDGGRTIFTRDSTLYNYGTITNKNMCTDIYPWGSSIEGPGYGSAILYNYGVLDNQAGCYIYAKLLHLQFCENSLFKNAGTMDSGHYFKVFEGAAIENSGTLHILHEGFGLFNYGLIHNTSAGTIINDGQKFSGLEGHEWAYRGGILLNDGLIENNTLMVFRHGGVFTNNGTLTNNGEVVNVGGIVENNGIFDNTLGTFQNQSTSLPGVFKGTGTFIGNLDSGIGTIAPGNSAGTMTVDGGFSLNHGGTLEIEIGGFDPGESDLLSVTQWAFLNDGTIRFSFLDGYDILADLPDYGDTAAWMFLETGQGIWIDDINGTPGFTADIVYDFLGTPAGFTYDVYLDGYDLWFSATNTNTDPGTNPVPAPGAFILALTGTGFASCLLRRRRAL